MKLNSTVFSWRRLVAALKSHRRVKRERAALQSSGLFDSQFYLRRYPDIAGAGLDPLAHFLRFGALEGRLPNALFDPKWYVETYPDVAIHAHNPLAHYILFGAAEGREPNPVFATRWYLSANPSARQAPTPLTHFVREGAAAFRDPSPKFSMAWYARQNGDAAEAGLDPLSHYLLVGRAQGRASSPLQSKVHIGEPVDDAWLTTVKPVDSLGDSPALVFVTHAPSASLKPHVAPLLQAFAAAGVQIVLIIAADNPFEPDPQLIALLAGCFIRENRGYDFAAWSHVLRLNRELYGLPTLILANDSVALKTGCDTVPTLLAAIAQDPSDIVGLTQSDERGWHLQSYFLALKPRALSSFALHNFLADVRILDDKDAVIQSYEVNFSSYMQAAGLTCGVVYRSRDETNQTLFHWRSLIDDGFPFVKLLVLKGEFPDVDITDWHGWLGRHGFDADMILASVNLPLDAPVPAPASSLQPTHASLQSSRTTSPGARPKVAFIGPWNYDNGLGAASRGYLSALWRLDLDLNLHPIKLPFHIHEQITPPVAVCDFIGPADVVIVHLNPDSWHLMTPDQQAVVQRAKICIGLWVWEMDTVPDAWRANIGRVDAVWAPSTYCAEVFAKALSAPVAVIPHVVTVADDTAMRPEAQSRLREAIGLEPDARVILYVFDGASYLVRKNPMALIRAFRTSDLAKRGWRLVLKTKNLMDRSEDGAALAALIAETPGTLLVDRSMSSVELAALFDLADIYASPHRSEGFGLTIAEAMARGKIVVASDYSGSRDFLDAGTGFPVPVRLKSLEVSYGHYLRGGLWAEVDEDAFADALQTAAQSAITPNSHIARAARERIAVNLSADAVAHAIEQALAALGVDVLRMA